MLRYIHMINGRDYPQQKNWPTLKFYLMWVQLIDQTLQNLINTHLWDVGNI